MTFKRTSQKPNWGRCGFCNAPVLTRRTKGTNKIVTLCKTPVYIILDPTSKEEFFYEGKWVKGRQQQDGLKAYRRHRCPHMRR